MDFGERGTELPVPPVAVSACLEEIAVSTIIECPACSTRYKMNKDIPEGGRYVKCARCGNQWRLVPEGYVEETIEPDEAEHNPVAPPQPFSFEQSREPIAAPETEPPASAHGPAGLPPWQSRPDHFGDTISTLSEPQAMNYGEAPAEAVDKTAGWQDADAGEPSSEPAFLYGFGLSANPPSGEDEDSASEDAAADDSDTGWEARMNRPWREIVEASRISAQEEEEDTEAAIREALKEALEQPGEEGAPTGQFQEQLRSQHEEHPKSGAGWDSFGPRGMQPRLAGAETNSETDEENPAEAEGADHPPFTVPGHDLAADPEQEDEAPFRLTGQSAKIYKAGDGEVDESEDGEEDEDSTAFDAEFQHDIEDAFRAGPLPKRSFEPGQHRHDKAPTDFDKFYDEQEAGGQLGPEFYDENAAALQAELESTDVATYETQRGGGGLAVAAAWAVFFSVLSGVALALVTLRSEIMAALPGTTSLYRAIGFDVAESGIDFADVSYRWTMAQGKPMIEVKGQVVNVTDRRLTVPRVLINVRDSQSQDTVKVTASVPTESLAPRESASFTLEFVSPPKNISQIELEFDHNQ
jgi:predicted Zn finger-like uncharacterized protein